MTYASTVLADSPVAFWKLDEASGTTAADSSGNARDATISGTVTYRSTGPTTQIPYAMVSNGSSGYVQLPSLSSVLGTSQAQTWEIVFYTATKIDSATSPIPIIGEASANSRYMYFGAVAGALTNEVITISTSGNVNTGWSGFTIMPGWHHLVLSFNGTQDGWTCVLDGADVTSSYWGGTKISANSGATGFGTFDGTVSRYSATYSTLPVAMVAAYNTNLSEATARTHWTAALSDPNVFDLTGVFTWVKSGSATNLIVHGIGAGGGGGAGRNQTSGTSTGGGGGGAGGREVVTIPWASVPSTLTVSVGVGGIGGQTSGTTGTNGGGTTVVNGATTYLSVGGGSGGTGGGTTTTAVSGGAGGTSAGGHTYTTTTEAGGAGGNGDSDANGVAGSNPGGGGGGGGDTGSTNATNGGAGGTGGSAGALSGGTGGVWANGSNGTNPTAGSNASDHYLGSGGGGGSGISTVYTSPTWATGANGGFPGGGGGGGGGKRDTTSVNISFMVGGTGANGAVYMVLDGTPIDLALSPATVTTTPVAPAVSLGTASIALSPATITVTPQSLGVNIGINLALSPATITVTPVAPALSLSGVDVALSPATVTVTPEALDVGGIPTVGVATITLVPQPLGVSRSVPLSPATITVTAVQLVAAFLGIPPETKNPELMEASGYATSPFSVTRTADRYRVVPASPVYSGRAIGLVHVYPPEPA